MSLNVGRVRRVSCWVILSSLATCWFFWVHVSRAADTLTVGQIMRDWEFRESSNKRFRLLFFSPEGSNSRYLGIQRMNFSIWSNDRVQIKVVWVANRGKPLRGTLKITQDGNLVLTDYNGTFINVNADQPAISSNTSATLLDNGNLVLRAGKRIVWQSFDCPSDTWLAGMKLGLVKSRIDQDQPRQQFLTSWLTRQVPTPGAFTLGVDPNNTNQLIILQRGVLYWQSGIWNGYNFSYFSDLFPGIFDEISFSYFSNESHSYFTFTRKDGNDSWIEVDSNGEIAVSEVTDSGREYHTYSCDVILPQGCVKPKQSTCKARGVFNQTSGTMDSWEFLNNSSLGISDCKDMCMEDCSCNAYASLQSDGTGCKISKGHKVDSLEEIFYIRSNNVVKKDNPNTIFSTPPTNAPSDHQNNTSLKNPNNISPPENPKRRQLWLIIGGPVASLLMFLLISLLCYLRWLNHCFRGNNGNKNNGNSRGAPPLMCDLNTELAAIEEFNNAHNPEYSGRKDHELPIFSLVSVEIATNHFSNANKIGEGGFGPVYKGKLVNHKEIAVKRLSKSSRQGLEEFKNEVILISKLQHRNLVRLLGCCIEGEERILIYEYLPNKSLDYFLFDAEKLTSLDWNLCVSIIEGIAQGLLYLHKYSRLRIIHRDLKTSNILLDSDMNPKISDFGTAKVFRENESQANTNRIVGTYGYMSPEYAIEGLFSVKSDVFSFGVMMLEIISGKRNIIGFNQANRSLNLPGHAWDLWKEGQSSELISSSIVETCSTNKAVRHIQISLLCVQESAADRPTMSEVLFMLNNDMVVLPTPKQPAFYTLLTVNAANLLGNLEPCSVNNVTISEVAAR